MKKLDAALKKAGINPAPYTGGPWSIFTHGGGPLVAKVWAEELLRTIGAPASAGNIAMVYNWEVSEGGGGKYNPLNQGPVPGQPNLTTTGQQYGGGASDFASWQAGIQGAAAYLNMPAFSGIKNALRANDPGAARSALIQSPWASSHYNWGAGFSNQAPPGGSIPALPPLPTGGQGPMQGVAPRVAGPSGGGGVTGPAPGGGGRGGGKGGGKGTGGGTGGSQAGAVQVGPDPQASTKTSGIVTTSAAGAAPQPGGTGSNPLLFPFVEGFDITKDAFTSAVSVGTALTAFSNNFRAFLQKIDFLVEPTSWVRIAAFFGGAGLVSFGVWNLSHVGGSVDVPVVGEVKMPGALPMGIAEVGAGGILLFVAFHQLPSNVTSFQSMLSWLAADIHKGGSAAPAVTVA